MPARFHPNDLMTVLEGIEDAVVKLDREGSYVAMNKAAKSIFQRLGQEPEHMKGKSIWQVFPGLKGTIVQERLTEAMSKYIPTTYEMYFPPDQQWYETQGYPTTDGIILIFRAIRTFKTIAGHSSEETV